MSREAQEPPRWFFVLCLLSLVNSAYGAASSLINALARREVNAGMIEETLELIRSFDWPTGPYEEHVESYTVNLMLNMVNVSALSFLFYCLNAIAVYLMLRQQRKGWYLYLLAQMALPFIPALLSGFNPLARMVLLLALIWNGLWVAVYGSQVSKLP